MPRRCKGFNKAILILLLVLLFTIPSVPLYAVEQGKETKSSQAGRFETFGDTRLAEILQLASLKNSSIPAAVEKVNQAREDVRNAAAGLGPTLSLGGTARYRSGRDEYNASLNLIQTVYAGGTLRANLRAAELALAAARMEGAKAYQDVMNTVRTHYYECLRAEAHVVVATEALTLAKEHLRQADSLFRRGIAPRGDVLRVQVSVTQSEVDLVGARGNLGVSQVALEHAIGARPPAFDGVLNVESQKGTKNPQPPEYRVPEDFIARSQSQRPEITAYEYYRARAEQLTKSAAGERLPKVTLSGRVNTDTHVNDEWHIQLEMQWMLYDGAAAESGVRRAKAAARELLYTLENLSSQVIQEVRQAEIRLRSAEERLELAARQSETAQEDYRLARRRYDAQLSSNLDVLDARRALIDSRTAYVDAVYDIALAQAGLVYAMGEDLPPGELFHGGKSGRSTLDDLELLFLTD